MDVAGGPRKLGLGPPSGAKTPITLLAKLSALAVMHGDHMS